MQIGIIGLPNVGKSTLFKILTKKQVAISNYPFCTIDPNVGVVKVPDERLKKIAKLTPEAKVLPAQIEFVDIAGLVRNAHKGEGLGNQFLAHIKEVDALVQVVRGFDNPDIQHTEKGVDPKRDIEIVNYELILKDLEIVGKRIEKVFPLAKTGDKKAIQEKAILGKIKNHLEKGKLLSKIQFNPEEKAIIQELNLLTDKPTIYLLNCDEKAKPKMPPNFPKPNLALPLKLELEISELPKEEQKEYRRELKLPKEGINTLISLAYKTLNLITFYTIKGGWETRAWPIPRGTLAPQAAGRVHSDFEQGFIAAEVIPWEKLVQAGSWQNAHKKGLIKTKGKDYAVSDGDVIEFRFKK